MSDFNRLKELVSEALALPSQERDAYLRGQTNDEALLAEARALLSHDVDGESPLTSAVSGHVASQAADLFGSSIRPKQVGAYEIVDILGTGGMGVVYRARQSGALEREVALKLIRPGFDSARVIARFESERRAVARMEHPGIAQVFDAGTTEDGLPWFAMELVDGDPVHQWCDEHDLDIDARLRIFEDVCRGVQHAHQKGIIHRDLKLSNILVTSRDGRAVPKIIDFGISKALGESDQMMTMDGQLIGTPEYMSPERLEGREDDVDIRSDVYSLGVLLYHLLSGTLPFDRSSVRRTGSLTADLESEPPRPSTRVSGPVAHPGSVRRVRLRKELQGDLDWITLKALALNPDERYATVQGLINDLQRHREGLPVQAGPPGVRYRLGKFARRHRASISVAALILLLLTGGLIESNRQRMRAEAALEEADSVTLFLTEMLASIRPEELGKDVTVRAALDQASVSLDSDLQGRELVRARLLTTIGRTYMVLGEYGKAESKLDEAVAIRSRRLGGNSSEALASRYHRAAVYLEQGRLNEAADELEDVLQRRRRVLGNRHHSTLGTLASLGGIYVRRGEDDRAELVYLEACDGFLATRGPRDEDTISCSRNLGDIYATRGEFDRADSLISNALRIQLEDRGPDDPGTLSARTSLAMLYYDRGDYAACEQELTAILESQRRTRGLGHTRTLESMINLASIRSNLEMLDSAITLLEEALPRCRTLHGNDHRTTLSCMNNLAWAYMQQGEFELAEPLFVETLQARRRVRGDDHVYTLITANNLGELYTMTGRPADGEALHREVLQIRRATIGGAHPHVMISMTNLASALREQGRYSESAALYEQSWELQCEVLGADHPDARKTAAEAMLLQEKWGRIADAETWRGRSSKSGK
ncbi:hypothetical protein DRQ53_01880 [bacterium]|nr:MAG: hypothetical protein DRQ53_01880 [bacterium]